MNTNEKDMKDTSFLDEQSQEIVKCKNCGGPLNSKKSQILCKDCLEMMLFQDVRDYIRKNDVTEYEVAFHFDIPFRLVKKWINEGRIEYEEHKLLQGGKCKHCSAPIPFGNYCVACLHLLDTEEMEKRMHIDKETLLDMLPTASDTLPKRAHSKHAATENVNKSNSPAKKRDYITFG